MVGILVRLVAALILESAACGNEDAEQQTPRPAQASIAVGWSRFRDGGESAWAYRP